MWVLVLLSLSGGMQMLPGAFPSEQQCINAGWALQREMPGITFTCQMESYPVYFIYGGY